MCGILGGFLPEAIPRDRLEAALARLHHRGPDDKGLLQEGGRFLAMRRLAVIDPSGGRQPMSDEAGRVSVVQNGEIYNYKELRDELRKQGHRFETASDTEVILRLYLERGSDFCEALRGMFAIAILDRDRDRLLLARDRFGKKPLYTAEPPGGGLLFASELKALLPLLEERGATPTLRAQGLYDYLSLGVVPQPETIYEGVHALEPGSLLCFESQRVTHRRFWSLAFEPKSDDSYPAARERVRQLVSESVRLRLRSDVPVGVFLSGGVDSSVVAYEAARQGEASLRLFTVAMGDPDFDESALAQRSAASLGLETTLLPLEYAPVEELNRVVAHYDQPFADSSAIPSLAVSRLARSEVKVVLNGDGGDEVFAGYRRHLASNLAARLPALPAGLARPAAALLGRFGSTRRSRLGFLQRFLDGLGRMGGSQYLSWTTDLLHEEDKAELWSGPSCQATEWRLSRWLAEELSGLDRQLAADIRISLLSDLLVKMDMATMACSLEARSPLLDQELAAYVARLPTHYKTRRLVPKYLLRDAYRDLLPKEVIWGPKRGFEVPMQKWIRHDFRELIGDTLAHRDARLRDHLDSAALNRVLEGRALRERNWPQLVYTLLVLELWLRQSQATVA